MFSLRFHWLNKEDTTRRACQLLLYISVSVHPENRTTGKLNELFPCALKMFSGRKMKIGPVLTPRSPGGESFNDWVEGGDLEIISRGCHQNSPSGGEDYMIPYMVGKLCTNRTSLTRRVVKYAPERGYFVPSPTKTRENLQRLPPPIPRTT